MQARNTHMQHYSGTRDGNATQIDAGTKGKYEKIDQSQRRKRKAYPDDGSQAAVEYKECKKNIYT